MHLSYRTRQVLKTAPKPSRNGNKPADKFALSFNSRMYTIQTNSEHTEIVVLSVSITITSIRGGQCELSCIVNKLYLHNQGYALHKS